MGTVTVPPVPASLEEIRSEEDGRSFPRHLLTSCDNALILFAAGFYGRQDAFWVADARKRATCVDNDPEKLETMRGLYPADWEMVEADVFFYATYTGRVWDLVTVDCPSGAFGRCADEVALWCSLATRAVVLGTGRDTVVEPPKGWQLTGRRHRSNYDGGVYWTILERM